MKYPLKGITSSCVFFSWQPISIKNYIWRNHKKSIHCVVWHVESNLSKSCDKNIFSFPVNSFPTLYYTMSAVCVTPTIFHFFFIHRCPSERMQTSIIFWTKLIQVSIKFYSKFQFKIIILNFEIYLYSIWGKGFIKDCKKETGEENDQERDDKMQMYLYMLLENFQIQKALCPRLKHIIHTL